jgi:heat-inducible transcriptional repressor
MALDERKQKILQAVVWSYVETADPVGSEILAQRYASWGVKSATIRNELAGLSEQGYLKQPYTSAGRIPSDQGYRFYVDHLMVAQGPAPEDIKRSKKELDIDRSETLERILRQTCALLTRMTRYTSLATQPRPTDTTIRQIFAAVAGCDTVLLVALFSNGNSEQRLIAGTVAVSALEDPVSLATAANALNAAWSGRTLDFIAGLSDVQMGYAPDGIDSIPARALYVALAHAVRNAVRTATSDSRAVIEGANEIFRQPEFQDVSKIEGVLESLQSRPDALEAFAEVASVVIGAENPIAALRDCTVITAPYYIGTRERGTLGVVGPTRMDYDRTVPAVSFMARNLSELLSHMA